MLNPAQSRAGRALLNWSQPQLAEASGVSVSTIRDFETSKRIPIANNLAAIQRALESAGMIFVEENGEGPGVRLRKEKPATKAWVNDAKGRAYRVTVDNRVFDTRTDKHIGHFVDNRMIAFDGTDLGGLLEGPPIPAAMPAAKED